ncbi:MAG: DNA internalization-related competence protein ComEC/Rec2, partial [Vicinamibacterales bacterium]
LAPCPGMRTTAAIPACGLIAGCAVGVAWPDVPFAASASVLVLSIAVSFLALPRAAALPLALGVALGCAACGVLLAQQAWQRAWRSSLRVAFESIAHDERQQLILGGGSPPEDDRAVVTLAGVLRDDASLTKGGAVSMRLHVQRFGGAAAEAADSAVRIVDGDAALTVVGRLAIERMGEWRRGRRVRLLAQLRRPTRYLDPGVVDQERVSARRGVSLVGTVKSGALVEVVGLGSRWNEAAARLRAFSRRSIADSVGHWSPRAAAIVTAIVIGDRTGLDSDIEQRLQEAGTYHVIAISGGNVAILAGLTVTAFRLAGLLGRAAMLSAIGGLLAYGSLVSGGASVDRATWMAVVHFAGLALDLRGPPLNTLALVAGVMVAIDPLAVADIGFLLTCGATAGIMLVGHLPLPALGPVARAVVRLGLASLAAEAALFPLSAMVFSRVTVAGLVLNFIAIPMMALAQIAGMLVVPLQALNGGLAMVVGAVAAIGAEALVRSAALVDWAPVVTWRLAAPSALSMTLYYSGVLSWWMLRPSKQTPAAVRVRGRRVRAAALLIATCSAVWILFEPWTLSAAQGDGRLHAVFIDVGQGDAALIRFPHGETMLVDAGGTPGGSFDVGDRVVGQVLRTLGIGRLDTVVLTHGDSDHIGGALSVVREFRPFDVWEGIPVPPSVPLQVLQTHARLKRIRWTRVQRDDEFLVGEVQLRVRHPRRADWERQDVRNDDSIVIELRWRDVSMVLTGDGGAEAELAVEQSMEPSKIRVLKVGHHGSQTSTSARFVQALQPDIAVVSVGRTNSFGHPAPEVIGRLESAGAAVYRTDRDGAVSVDTDGISLNVATFTGRTAHIQAKATTPERRH